MISKSIQDAINEQIKNEIYSSYLYLSMSAYFEALSLPGSGKWMRVQHQEELGHAMKFLDYVHDQGGRVTLKAIDQPPVEFQSPLDAWQKTLEHEKKVTAMIQNLYGLALKENDYATQAMLQWFIKEQIEEEKTATLMVERFKQVANQPALLMMFDGHFTKRGE